MLGILDARAAVQVLIGARVRLLGNAVERRAIRHYLGRIFATAASLALSLDMYDTQCGAKLFRVTPALTDALADPFGSRWIFDVELLGRLANGRRGIAPVPLDAFAEVPLLVWHDVAGSKVRPGHFLRAAGELADVWLRVHRNCDGVRLLNFPPTSSPSAASERLDLRLPTILPSLPPPPSPTSARF